MSAPQLATDYDRLRLAYIASYNASDSAGLAGLFSDDAVFMPPEYPPVRGRDGIKSYYDAGFELFSGELEVNTEEIQPAGEAAYSFGTFRVKATPKQGGEALEMTGSYMNVVGRQADGSLKIVRHIWNTPTPMPLPRQ